MRRLITVIVLLFVFGSATNLHASRVEWSVGDGNNGHFYEPVALTQAITWIDARDAAVAAGGYLCTITSVEENKFVFDLVKDLPEMWRDENGATGPWLGGYQENKDSEPAGGWRWVTDEDWGYTNWSPGQPDNMANVEDWLHFHGTQYPYQWNDVGYYLDLPHSYIVEYVPEPATILLLGLGGLSLLRRRKM